MKTKLNIGYEKGTLTPQQLLKFENDFIKHVPEANKSAGMFIVFEDRMFQITKIFVDITNLQKTIEIQQIAKRSSIVSIN